jgi:hypothetical protein
MKKVTLTLLIGAVVLLSSCEDPNSNSADDKIQKETEASMAELNRQVGMPAIVNYQEKKLMKQIYELRDQENVICFAYYIDMNGKKNFLGKCVGYGLPYSTQYSNPQKYQDVIHSNGGSYGKFMPQAEPNGLFMPDGMLATWLLLINPEDGKPHPVYIESEILVSPFKLH